MPCQLCGRDTQTTRHHLVPKKLHRRLKKKKGARQEDLNATVDLCRACHKTVHHHISEAELARHYSTLEALAAHEEVARFASWVADKPVGFMPKTPSYRAAAHLKRR